MHAPLLVSVFKYFGSVSASSIKKTIMASAVLILLLIPAVTAHAQTIPGQSTPLQVTPPQAKQALEPTKEPKPELERPSIWGEPTRVEVGIYVLDIDNVDSANQSFSASVYIVARWKIPLLKHKGPGPLIRSTTDVWTPRLTIVNQQQAWSAFPSAVEIYPNGEVVSRQKTWGWFSQPLDLRNFPFDRQTLTIHLVTAGLLQSEVQLAPFDTSVGKGRSGVAKQLSLPDFDVVSWKVEPRPYVAYKEHGGTAGYVMEIEIQRRAGFYIWKIIFPLCLIVMMSWIPRWLDPTEVGSNIGIATSSFLTLVAYLFAITLLLPRVSYLTRMDKFVLLSTLMVFIGLVHTVTTARLSNKTSMATLARIEFVSRFVYPILLVAILWFSFLR
ncbi:MAG: hypothetical protein WCC36_15345 [Gammaproteobacteria bacterium]